MTIITRQASFRGEREMNDDTMEEDDYEMNMPEEGDKLIEDHELVGEEGGLDETNTTGDPLPDRYDDEVVEDDVEEDDVVA